MTAWRREASERTGPFVSPRLSVAVDGLKGRARAQKQRGDSALLRSQDAGEAPITLQTQTHNTCNLTRRMHIACFQKVRYRIVARINRASEGPSSSLLSTLAQPALTSDMGCVECCQPASYPALSLPLRTHSCSHAPSGTAASESQNRKKKCWFQPHHKRVHRKSRIGRGRGGALAGAGQAGFSRGPWRKK